MEEPPILLITRSRHVPVRRAYASPDGVSGAPPRADRPGQLLTDPAISPPMNQRPSSTYTTRVGSEVISAPAIEAA